MLTTALVMFLASADVQPAFLPSHAPRTIRLVGLGERAPGAYRGWTSEQLLYEHDRLDDLRPGIALPVVALMVGLSGIIASLVGYAIAVGTFRGPSTEANIIFGIGSTVSLGLTAFGIIQIARGAEERKILGRQMEKLQRMADGMERDERLLDLWEQRMGPNVPPPIGPDPVGPMPPLSAPPIVPSPPISMVLPLVSGTF